MDQLQHVRLAPAFLSYLPTVSLVTVQVQRDESSLLVLPYFSDSRRTRQQADTETCLVGYNYTVWHESLSDMGTSSRSNIQYQLKRTCLLFLIDCCHI